jgi:hypothetical protein
MKDKMFILRITEKLLNDYKEFCDANSINMSQRIRRYMERDLDMWKSKNKNK